MSIDIFLSNLKNIFPGSLKKNDGFGIVEIIIAISIMSIALFAISEVSVIYLKQSGQNKDSLKALYLAEEGLEAARSARDQSWSGNITSLTMGNPYFPVISANKWTLSNINPGLIDNIYTRQVIVTDVSRGAGDNIVTSGGINDPNTKKIVSTVSWGTKSTSLTTYLTNLYNN